MTWLYIALGFMVVGLLGVFWTFLFAAERSDHVMELLEQSKKEKHEQ